MAQSEAMWSQPSSAGQMPHCQRGEKPEESKSREKKATKDSETETDSTAMGSGWTCVC